MAEITYKFDGFKSRVTMRVIIKVSRLFVVRQWLAVRLIIIAAWLLDCNVEFAEDVSQTVR